jgi:hypothetical protein
MGNNTSAEQQAKFRTHCLPCTAYEVGYEGLMYCDGRCNQLSTVWGTGPYVADSCPCRAARHAGVIPANAAGCFKVLLKPGQERYEGSTAHGVTSFNCGQAKLSIVVEKAQAA